MCLTPGRPWVTRLLNTHARLMQGSDDQKAAGRTVLVDCLEAVRIVAVLIAPITPSLSQRILAQLSLDASAPLAVEQAHWGGEPSDPVLGPNLMRSSPHAHLAQLCLQLLSGWCSCGAAVAAVSTPSGLASEVQAVSCRAAQGPPDKQACTGVHQARGRLCHQQASMPSAHKLRWTRALWGAGELGQPRVT